MRTSAIYAGTFDPITAGHLDLVERAAQVFDKLVLAVVRKGRKQPLFSVEERLDMAREVTAGFANVEVADFDGLLVDFARSRNILVIVRGLRAFSDFEYEFQMALTNRKLAPEIETLFLMPKETHSYMSSSMVREIAELGGDISEFVPACVIKHIEKGFAKRRRGSTANDS